MARQTVSLKHTWLASAKMARVALLGFKMGEKKTGGDKLSYLK